MAKDDIKIIITRNGEAVGNPLTQEGQQEIRSNGVNSNGESTRSEMLPTSSIGKTVAIQMGTKALQYGISNYGNLTGDYIAQDSINSVVQLASMGAMVASGPVGAVAAALSVGIETVSYIASRAKQDYEARMYQARVGAFITSRGR